MLLLFFRSQFSDAKLLPRLPFVCLNQYFPELYLSINKQLFPFADENVEQVALISVPIDTEDWKGP